ncbi:preprotein translocase subunit SecA, partial [bacterium]
MATGEGKTLVATMPMYLNALALNHHWVVAALDKYGDDIDRWDFEPLEDKNGTKIPVGRGVHLVTVNDYLARRDAQWMGKIYEYLGLSVGVVHEGIEPHSPERKEQYLADITYGTNNAFGFDYLRDNMVPFPEGVVQREHFYSIIDEVDSVLIDEARTPLIISGPVQSNISEQFKRWNSAIRHLVNQQAKQSARLLNEAKKMWEQARSLEAEGKGGEADKLRKEAGQKLLMVKRSAPKNPQYLKLIKQPDILKAISRAESERLRDKNMYELDEQLYFAVDEHENSINLMDKGRDELARYANVEKDIFILPDLADELSQIEGNENLSEKQKEEEKLKIHKKFAQRGEINHAITQLLKAYVLFAKDVDYVVQQGKVVIVDEFTGRLMPGRRYSEGLHQALEAKEGVRVEGETQTYAQITFQNYFRMYRKLAGMTGTAITEAPEFWEIYKLDVVQIPTNRPVRREDFNDRVYLTRREKFNAVMDEIEYYHNRNQPVLVGTVSVDISETLSRMLKRKKIPHSVLNAKHHQKEAEIVALAGQPGAVTIATNMAGRGTDIKLGIGVVRAYELVFSKILEEIGREVQSSGKSFLLVAENEEVLRNLTALCKDEGLQYRVFSLRESAAETVAKFLSDKGKVALFAGFELANSIPAGNYERKDFPKPKCALRTNVIDKWTCPENPKECIKKGIPCGLHIIGTERHESRRIDNQLRGRAGRQGDPGSSRFFVSLQDDLMRLYAGGDRAYNMIKRLNPPEGEPIEAGIISKQIAAAQKRVEAQNFSIRKHLLEYDDVMNKQREVIYSLRKNILFGGNLKPEYKRLIREFCEDLVDFYTDPQSPQETWDWKGMLDEFSRTFLVRFDPHDEKDSTGDLVEDMYKTAMRAYELKESIRGDSTTRSLERAAMLATIDQLWKEHLRALDEIKEGSYLFSYAQKDPLVEYKKEAFSAFENLIADIRRETLTKFFHAQVVQQDRSGQAVPLRAMHQKAGYGAGATAAIAQREFGAQKPQPQSP